jgi:hypothetical protein
MLFAKLIVLPKESVPVLNFDMGVFTSPGIEDGKHLLAFDALGWVGLELLSIQIMVSVSLISFIEKHLVGLS